MRRWPPSGGGSKLNGSLPSSRAPAIGAGQPRNTQTSVIPALGATAPGFTFGAGPSKSTRERPSASVPVTIRRIGFIVRLIFAILPVAVPHNNLGGETMATRREFVKAAAGGVL